MPYEITSADIEAGGDFADLIAWADTADACMTAKGVPAALGKTLKIYLVKHVLQLERGGSVSSETAVSGASRSFATVSGLQGTSYGKLLSQMDKAGCVLALISNNGTVQLRSAGRRS